MHPRSTRSCSSGAFPGRRSPTSAITMRSSTSAPTCSPGCGEAPAPDEPFEPLEAVTDWFAELVPQRGRSNSVDRSRPPRRRSARRAARAPAHGNGAGRPAPRLPSRQRARRGPAAVARDRSQAASRRSRVRSVAAHPADERPARRRRSCGNDPLPPSARERTTRRRRRARPRVGRRALCRMGVVQLPRARCDRVPRTTPSIARIFSAIG